MGFRNMLRTLMAGRNGIDSLFYFCFVIYLILYGINFIFRSAYIHWAMMILLVLVLFRMLSKNLPQRKKEADAFNRFFGKVVPNAELTKRKLAEGRTHSFHECPYCGSILRFPRKRGKFNVTCPKCQQRITIRNWF